MGFPIERIRNFCIIAHIDHGKSTLADRFLEATGTLAKSEMRAQVLDTMDLERERGITIKSHPIRMQYRSPESGEYVFNLIDTPGHVDFTYEVSRSLSACEGAILVVDAAQGIQAQTVSNVYLAVESGLEMIPVINKIDLATARVDDVTQELVDLLGVRKSDILKVSARDGSGIEELMEEVVRKIPPPMGDRTGKLRTLIFDSHFDMYKGAIVYVRVFDGTLHSSEKVRMLSNGRVFEVMETGFFRLRMEPAPALHAGEVGFIVTGIKNLQET